MTKSLRHLFCSFLLLLALFFGATAQAYAAPPWATGQSRGEDLSIYLLTFSPGDDIASWFGHTAFMVRDERLDAERIYNYGMFNFGADMLPKFLMGRLEFWVGEAHVDRTLQLYRSLNRDIISQELNLPPEKRLELAKFLAWNVRPENRDYLYDHYFDNCATRIRDAIDVAVDGQFKKAMDVEGRLTLRGHTRRHSQRNPYVDALLMLWMNDDIDKPIRKWDEMFLPYELHDRLEEFEYIDARGEPVPIVQERKFLFDAPEREAPAEDPNQGWIYMLLAGLVLGGIAIALARWYRKSDSKAPRILFGLHNTLLGILVGIPGIVIPLFHLTEHRITYFNENAFLTNPLAGLALPLGIAVAAGAIRPRKWLKWAWTLLAFTSVLGLVLKIFPWFDQNNWMLIALFVPLNLGFAAAFWIFEPDGATEVDLQSEEEEAGS